MDYQEILESVGPGWSEILKQLILDLDDLNIKYEVHCVKEKFGGLRFITEILEPNHQKVGVFLEKIQEAESLSYQICETCGKTSATTQTWNGFWLKTLCQTCGNIVASATKTG